MRNEFSERLKRIDEELLNLKTACEYTSTRNVYTTSPTRVTSGRYRISYNAGGQHIMSEFYKQYEGVRGVMRGHIPSGNTQVVEVDTTVWHNNQPTVYENGLIIVSNVPVTNIVRL